NAGGTFDLNGHSDVVGALSVLAGGTFNTAGSGQGHLTIFTNNPNGLSLASGSTVSMKIGDSASNTDLISAHSAQLGGRLQLMAGTLAAVGTSVTIVHNEADNSSTFHRQFHNAPNFVTLVRRSEILNVDYFTD